ncbi:MAG: caspase family protein [Betaproteobacteria bacterium]|nr:caspase family protein [Betaproteobacteria bacterium]
MNVRRPTRREFLQLGAATALVPGIVMPAAAAADPSRLALVVGNDAYPGAPLSNAVNDAKAMAALLGEAGFGVDLRTNVDRTAFGDATRQFAEAAQKSDVKLVFFYYAGHGAQLDWRNYLLPVDARVNTSADLPAQCVDLASLLTGLARAKGKTFVIVLDACRDNPFGASFRPAQKGLSQFDAPSGSLLAFSTAPGRVAADASGASAQSGLYAEHLVRELSVRATRLEDALKRVRLAVRIASKGAQVPWESTSLESDVFLFPAARKLTEAELEAEIQRELDAWNRVKGSKEPNEWAAFLRDYPSGRFAEIAQTRLAYFAARDEAARAPVQIAAAPAQPALSAVPAQGLAPTVATPEIVLAEPRVREPAQLVVGSGPDVPVLMRPSANPNSAGTYAIDRGYSVGDEVVYLQSDPVYGGATKTLTWRITKVDLDADRVEINDGFIVLDSMGNPLVWDGATYEPRLQAIPAEVQVGKRWTTRFNFSSVARIDRSPITTTSSSHGSASSFRSARSRRFRIDGDGFNKFGARASRSRHWLVPGVNYSLRTDTIRYDGRSLRAQYAERREMVSCRQMRWRQA